MGVLVRRLLLLSFAAAMAVPTGSANAASLPKRPHVSWLQPAPNFTAALRKPQQIRFIVIHVTEGSFWGSVAWLRNPHSHGSANFVVSRGGHIVELVPPHDIAWHAGNWVVNTESVGIEHAGFTDSSSGFTMREYRASARLTAYLARLSLIPIDRRHIIGHSEVPDPSDPLAGGGIDNHTDPGRHWRWGLYLRLVRGYAFPPRPVPRPRQVPKPRHVHVGLDVRSSTVYGGQVLAGTVPWRAKVSGPVRRVAFLVDGRVRWRDSRPPFAFARERGWDTLSLPNGRHKLELRAYGPKGSWTRDRFLVRVKNEPFVLRPLGIRAQARVAGTITMQALALGAPVRRVVLYLDGRAIARDSRTPYTFRWNSLGVADGPHALVLAARAPDGRVARTPIPVVVANAAAGPVVLSDTLVKGQTVAGLVPWELQLGGSVQRVDFLVDGAVRASVTSAPYGFTWDTAAESPGPHQLVARVVSPDGRTAEDDLDVVVAPPAG
ncbi:MAG TPA: N-acetylmuramoyl-L-alanine amidase [Gaiellaceae bacterium]|jgi:N-acetyl-anhydromuramyl-L-alanine amidase AmpD